MKRTGLANRKKGITRLCIVACQARQTRERSVHRSIRMVVPPRILCKISSGRSKTLISEVLLGTTSLLVELLTRFAGWFSDMPCFSFCRKWGWQGQSTSQKRGGMTKTLNPMSIVCSNCSEGSQCSLGKHGKHPQLKM